MLPNIFQQRNMVWSMQKHTFIYLKYLVLYYKFKKYNAIKDPETVFYLNVGYFIALLTL